MSDDAKIAITIVLFFIYAIFWIMVLRSIWTADGVRRTKPIKKKKKLTPEEWFDIKIKGKQ